MLSRAWLRHGRAWWAATVVTLGLVVALLIVVMALFAGTQEEVDGRVAAFFTGEVRVTPVEAGVAPTVMFPAGALADAQEASGADLRGSLESPVVLSRRSLLEAYLEEDEQFRVDVPGAGNGTGDGYGIGILIGLDPDDRDAWRNLAPYRTSGRWPGVGDDGVVEVMMATYRLDRFLTPAERASLPSWPPDAADLARFRFEITTAYVDPDAPFKDVIRRPARIVGLFDTGLDALDSVAVVVPIQDARTLVGRAPNSSFVNVITGPAELTPWAASHGHATEDAPTFSKRYVGQLIDVVQALALLSTSLLAALPAFLIWFGLSQALRRQHKEMRVARAIGVARTRIGAATGLLVSHIALRSFLAALAVVAVTTAMVLVWLASWSGSPLPLGIRVRWTHVVAGGLVLVATSFIAWLGAGRPPRRASAARGLSDA